MIPTEMNNEPLTIPSATRYSTAPPAPAGPSSANPARVRPTWLTVAYASIRARWCWSRHITPPTRAVVTAPSSMTPRSPSVSASGAENTVQ